MYSPKIKEDLIPYLYRLARHQGIPMTRLVNRFIESMVSQFRDTGIFREIEQEEKVVKALSDHITRLINDRRKKTGEVIELLKKIA